MLQKSRYKIVIRIMDLNEQEENTGGKLHAKEKIMMQVC